MMNIDTPEGMTAAKEWTQGLLSSLNEGGVWAVPRSMSVYRFWHTSKEYTLALGDGGRSVNKVLSELGWTKREAPKP